MFNPHKPIKRDKLLNIISTYPKKLKEAEDKTAFRKSVCNRLYGKLTRWKDRNSHDPFIQLLDEFKTTLSCNKDMLGFGKPAELFFHTCFRDIKFERVGNAYWFLEDYYDDRICGVKLLLEELDRKVVVDGLETTLYNTKIIYLKFRGDKLSFTIELPRMREEYDEPLLRLDREFNLEGVITKSTAQSVADYIKEIVKLCSHIKRSDDDVDNYVKTWDFGLSDEPMVVMARRMFESFRDEDRGDFIDDHNNNFLDYKIHRNKIHSIQSRDGVIHGVTFYCVETDGDGDHKIFNFIFKDYQNYFIVDIESGDLLGIKSKSKYSKHKVYYKDKEAFKNNVEIHETDQAIYDEHMDESVGFGEQVKLTEWSVE